MLNRFLATCIAVLMLALPAYGQDLKSKVVPLNGKLIQSDDPTQIGTNFQTLQNLRYTDSHVKGIGGMAKVNSSALSSYPHVRNAYHFNKVQPAESHVLLHALDATGTSARLIEIDDSIPTGGNVDEATPICSLTSYAEGLFATVPNDYVVFTNGEETYIWGGKEGRLSAFLTSSTTPTYVITNSNDYTEILNNTRTEASQVATLSSGGGNDSYVKLLLHADGSDTSTTLTDSSSTGRAVTANGNAQLDTAQFKFGTASGLFDGTGDYLTVADHADWNLGDGDFTIDFWVRFNSVDTVQAFWSQGDGGGTNRNYLLFNSNTIEFMSYNTDYLLSFNAPFTPVVNTWYHIELVRSTASTPQTWFVFVNGESKVVTGTHGNWAATLPDFGQTLKIGIDDDGATYPLNGWMDEFRWSKGVARHTANFTVQTQAYGNASNHFLVGSKRPLQGVKFYVSSGNTVASTMTAKEWQGTDWTDLAITDNTDTGATLATTGTVTWTATGSAKQRYIDGLSLYWYAFFFDAGQASLYYTTVDAPMQTISNTWDGIEIIPIRTLKYNGTTYYDYSIEVADDYQSTYADLSSLGTTHYLVIGFTEPIQGLDFTFVVGLENSTAATMITTEYWNGSAWTATGATSDGTATSTTSMSKGGTVVWQGVEQGQEFVTTVSNEVPLYYYRVRFADTLDADVKVSEIRGIPFPRAISPYAVATMYQNRTILMNESSGKKNKLLYSAEGLESVFNGDDSGELNVGDDFGITSAATLSLVLTSALEQLIIFKENQTYRIFGNGPENWDLQLISGTVGCVAPKTLKTASLPLDSVSNYIGRHIAIFQGADGIYVTDGRTPSPIHGDIKNYFDKRSSSSINTSMLAKSVGFIDHENLEYHWLFASGSSTTLNKELVFDLRRWKWFEIDRGTGKYLQVGFKVTDTYGNNYCYGAIDTGYIERLEYGNTFDGDSIVHTFQLGDIAFADNPMFETRAQYANLAMVAKTTTSNSVTYTHYVDTATSGTAYTLSPASSGKRVANVVTNINSIPGVFHSPKFSMTTNNETVGFEPLYIGYFYKVEREHLR